MVTQLFQLTGVITQDMYEAVKDDIAKCIEGYKKNNVANEEDL